MGSCQSVSGAEKGSESRQKGKPQLLIKTFTWSRDSHGLFDYESKTLTKKNMKSGNSGRIVRRLNDVNFNRENDQPINPSDRDLLHLSIREGNYWVAPNRNQTAKKAEKIEEDNEDSEHNLWMVVKSFRPTGSNRNGCKLNEGDLLKLGRIKFKVKELRGSTAAAQAAAEKKASIEKLEKHTKIEEDNISVGDDSPKRNSKGFIDSKGNLAQTCRICLGEQCEAEDPFFSPCRCTGTMRYIHVQCLQRWLKGKLHVKTTNFSTSVHWKTLECELCKTTYQSSYYIDSKKYDIVEVERPECGYLMLEILSKEKNVTRGIHIIKMEGKNNVRLGRGHDSDIRVTDISVSRCHAIIRLEKGSFFIEDNASKFGTLMYMKKPFALFGDYNNVSLQVGRTVVTLSVKKNWKALQGCLGGDNVKNPIEMEYDDMFDKVPEGDYQNSEAVAIRNPIAGEPNQNIGAFDDNGDGNNNNDIAPHEGNGDNDEVDLDNDNLSDLDEENEEPAEQQVVQIPQHLVQPQIAQRAIDQGNENQASVVQNVNVDASANQQAAQAFVQEDQAVPEVNSGLAQNPQSQAIVQTN